MLSDFINKKSDNSAKSRAYDKQEDDDDDNEKNFFLNEEEEEEEKQRGPVKEYDFDSNLVIKHPNRRKRNIVFEKHTNAKVLGTNEKIFVYEGSREEEEDVPIELRKKIERLRLKKVGDYTDLDRETSNAAHPTGFYPFYVDSALREDDSNKEKPIRILTEEESKEFRERWTSKEFLSKFKTLGVNKCIYSKKKEKNGDNDDDADAYDGEDPTDYEKPLNNVCGKNMMSRDKLSLMVLNGTKIHQTLFEGKKRNYDVTTIESRFKKNSTISTPNRVVHPHDMNVFSNDNSKNRGDEEEEEVEREESSSAKKAIDKNTVSLSGSVPLVMRHDFHPWVNLKSEPKSELFYNDKQTRIIMSIMDPIWVRTNSIRLGVFETSSSSSSSSSKKRRMERSQKPISESFVRNKLKLNGGRFNFMHTVEENLGGFRVLIYSNECFNANITTKYIFILTIVLMPRYEFVEDPQYKTRTNNRRARTLVCFDYLAHYYDLIANQ